MPQFNPPLADAEIDAAFPGQFRLVSVLFAGGQGTVFRVERPDGTIGALKIYVPDPGANLDERTAREVAILQQLARPTVVRLDAHGMTIIRTQDCRFVCTSFIEGASLAQRLAVGPSLTVADIARIGHDIADAIDALWDAPNRIVHRDIKPPNVMLSTSGHAVLIDLGIARHTSLHTLTLTGSTWGTPGYMSPEQARARKALTCKSDVFALGVMLQQCLAGRHPTNGNQAALLNGGPPTSALAPAASPTAVLDVIDAMVAKDANRRPMPSQVRAALAPHAKPPGMNW